MNKRKTKRSILVEDLLGEIWIPIKEGRYYCSNFGRIKSVRQFVYVYKETIMTNCITHKGYHTVFLLSKNRSVHRLVAKLFIENPENKPQVNHKNANKTDNSVSNLEWVTNDENQEHAVKMKLRKGINIGEIHPMSLLKEKEVLLIFNSNKPISFLAKRFNISNSMVEKIKNGNNWSHVTKKKWIRQKKMLTKQEAIEIFHSPLSNNELAEKYGVKKSAIFNLKSGHSHSRITGKVYSPKRRAA